MARPLAALPKAHLHLHFTGSMRHATLVDLATKHGVHLPEALREDWPPQLSGADERGWFRFQRLYDIARSVLRTEADLRRLVRETAEDERREGSGWLEIQVDPSGLRGAFRRHDRRLGAGPGRRRGRPRAATGVGIGVIIAANRTRHPLDARTLARLASGYAGHGVVGFGSATTSGGHRRRFRPGLPDRRRGPGLLAVPHGGELMGPASVRACLDDLNADRIGHGVAAAADPELCARLAARRITLEVCPASNVALGVAASPADVPLRALLDAGVPVALGADDPLLFGSPADGPVRAGPARARAAGRDAGRAGPDVRPRVSRPGRAPHRGCWPGSTPGWPLPTWMSLLPSAP